MLGVLVICATMCTGLKVVVQAAKPPALSCFWQHLVLPWTKTACIEAHVLMHMQAPGFGQYTARSS